MLCQIYKGKNYYTVIEINWSAVRFSLRQLLFDVRFVQSIRIFVRVATMALHQGQPKQLPIVVHSQASLSLWFSKAEQIECDPIG